MNVPPATRRWPVPEMWLQDHLSAGDHLRFDRFMELALDDPEHGYYSSKEVTIGPRGDFATSPTLSGSLALALAAWIRQHRPRHVIELGPGTGQLARALLRNLDAFGFARRAGLRLRPPAFTYHLVERSPVLAAAQRKILRHAARWHRTVEEALHAAGGEAFLFSNEFVDAFPVRVFRCGGAFQDFGELPSTSSACDELGRVGPEPVEGSRGAPSPPHPRWQELFVQISDHQLKESFLPSESLPDSAVFDHHWPPGQSLEVNESYRLWLAGWLPHWKAGQMLTIDYGGSSQEIYHRRPAGTLRAYYRHQCRTGPDLYSLPGRQDLTADVNFDDLARWGEQLGLQTVSLATQREFLLPHLDSLPLPETERFLTDPHGAGTAFKVLLQRR